MKMDDAIVEFGFDCKVRKLSVKTVANYQKQLRYIEKYISIFFAPFVFLLAGEQGFLI